VTRPTPPSSPDLVAHMSTGLRLRETAHLSTRRLRGSTRSSKSFASMWPTCMPHCCPVEPSTRLRGYGLVGGEAIGAVGQDTSGPTTDDAMTRSEEYLVAGTEQVEAGRARLRKYVVTETQRVDVPVSHEEVRLEREPITDANQDAAYSGGDITDEEHEVTLRAERPVVTTETEPVERVRLGKETVTGTETVSGEVRKEQVELDDPTGTARDR
jgi:uncharacterized protein (TIGR02271 family)